MYESKKPDLFFHTLVYMNKLIGLQSQKKTLVTENIQKQIHSNKNVLKFLEKKNVLP